MPTVPVAHLLDGLLHTVRRDRFCFLALLLLFFLILHTIRVRRTPAMIFAIAVSLDNLFWSRMSSLAIYYRN